MSESAISDEELEQVLEFLQQFKRGKYRYEVLESIGEGGFGSIVQCFDNHLNRVIARKLLHKGTSRQLSALRFLLNEARLLSYLNHPGIVPIYDAFVGPDGHFCYTMMVLEGEDLSSIIKRYESFELKMPLNQALQIFTKVCEAMAYSHDKGVLHLDIKPPNVMVGTYGEVLLLDWGAARLYDRAPYEEYLSNIGKQADPEELEDPLSEGVATVPYSSLEQITELRETLTPAADVFSAGMLLYHMLTHDFPYDTSTPEAYVRSLIIDEPIPLSQHRGDIPIKLSELCMRMVDADVEDRIQDFHQVLEELQSLNDAGQSFATQTYEPKEVLIREGEHGDHALQILEGTVEISTTIKGEKKVLAVRRSGETIGELAVFSGSPRTATVIALEKTVVKILTRQLIEDELDKLNPWISHMIRGLSTSFIKLTNEKLGRGS